MGGIVISKEIENTVNEVNEQYEKPSDASDINNLKQCKEEIAKLRFLCHSIRPINKELIERYNNLNIYQNELEEQQERPLDISDINDLNSGKNEIIKLRNIWISIKLSNNNILNITTSSSSLSSSIQLNNPSNNPQNNPQNDNENNKNNENNYENIKNNPIIKEIQSKITNETALDYFRKYDLNGSGLIERNELRRFIRMHNIVYSDDDLEHLLDMFDINDDGNLSYGEFLRAFSQNSSVLIENSNNITNSMKSKLNLNQPLESFKLSDKDSSGLVDRSEMRRLLRVNGITYREEDFESFFTLHDYTGDGKLNFQEFCRAMGYCP